MKADNQSQQLFRQEVLNNKGSNTLGGVLLRQPKEYKWMASLLLAVVVIALTLLVFGNYSKYASVFGVITVDKGLVKISAGKEGHLVQQLVKEGDRVEKGDLLYVISTDRHSSFDNNLDQTILEQQLVIKESFKRDIQLAAEAFAMELALLDSKIATKHQEIAQINQQLELYDQRILLSEKGIARNRQLLAAGHTNQAQIDMMLEDHLSLLSKRNDLQMKLVTTQAAYSEMQANLDKKPGEFDEQQNRLKRNLIENEQRTADISSNIDYRIYAPLTGIVGNQFTHVGEFIRKSSVMASVIPEDSQLQAELYVPASSIGFIQSGQLVTMRYSAFPYQHFGLQKGTVISVAKVISLPEELETSVQLNGAVYKVIVALESQSVSTQHRDIALGIGMELEASIQLEQRTLMQWILAPIYSLRDS
ncbi:HlyD family secretion protein [Shewanella sp. NIFS-20-20]|uniref:HlyD family secretion protein n=1 Tax=Shewanella sp. NIFS-20-20 TaxID=2853806 RepID=UPI001C466618|nr:HlyD family efflux transporter periplasmic adaptor subunit [Shewanella sp. NIFS-20-20]MBV7314957.1 HlyD family efflux transporter periplasmic adaptor subunit [Shewanella sp. NIFS-20-20]